jgi:heat-inducible transcriptional repressor
MLSERNRKVLCAVVQSYINKPDPVGSRFVTKKYAFNLSPATIRNIMADLEEMGFLSQPHTSAGRIPTDKGYRFYVDSLCREKPTVDAKFSNILKSKLESIKSDIYTLLKEATETLAAMSHYLVFAVPLKTDSTTLNRIQLFRYRNKQTVAVLLTNEGLVRSKMLDTNFGLSQKDLNRISDYLNSEFSGCTIDEIRSALIKQMSKEKALCDILISKAIAICKEALFFPSTDLIVSGFSELIGLPDFSGRIKEIAKAIEDKHTILKLLDRLSASTDGVKVVIGSENPMEELKKLSIVMATYKQGDRSLGSVGVIGPTRMDYSKTIPMVELTAKSISAVISR